MPLTTAHEIELHQESARETENEILQKMDMQDEELDDELENELDDKLENERDDEPVMEGGEDAFLDSYMEDRIGGTGLEDYEPNPYDGTYSEM